MHEDKMLFLRGIGVSEGIVMGHPYIINRSELTVHEVDLKPGEVEKEIERFHGAIETSKEQLSKIRATFAKTTGEDSAQIIDAQLMVLEDVSMIEEVVSMIRAARKNPEFVLESKMDETIERLEKAESEYMRERAHDVRDVKRRIISNLLGQKKEIIKKPHGEWILVIDHLAPSETAQVFHQNFAGIVCEMGGKTSHVAIMTKTMEIPTVLGAVDATRKIPLGSRIIIDGKDGNILVNPPEKVEKKYSTYQKKLQEKKKNLNKIKLLPPQTIDEYRVTLSANIELPEEVAAVKKYNAEGIGLFRTEVIYTTQKEAPTEDEQYEIYKKLSEDVKDHSIIIRTFDIGGDKFSVHFDHSFEPNPFLGWRAIRIGLTYPDLLKTQLRAILRASVRGNLKLMFPMISTLDEIKQARQILDDTMEELQKENIEFDNKIETGIMIEVPSAAILARELAPHVDFFSIGTNDLIQYTMAADRGNARVSYLYQSYNPAVLKLIKYVVDAGHYEGIWVGLCGEMAGDPRAIVMLLGMGMDEFSTNPIAVPMVKSIIRSVRFSDAQKLAEQVLRFTTEKEVLDYIDKMNKEILPQSLLENQLFNNQLINNNA
ncbi:phosphoenolpyruvate--protein phosphotransferase [bacterium]|nr:phosphoenolpyruvate--protein phosphotransferase [bacterium]